MPKWRESHCHRPAIKQDPALPLPKSSCAGFLCRKKLPEWKQMFLALLDIKQYRNTYVCSELHFPYLKKRVTGLPAFKLKGIESVFNSCRKYVTHTICVRSHTCQTTPRKGSSVHCFYTLKKSSNQFCLYIFFFNFLSTCIKNPLAGRKFPSSVKFLPSHPETSSPNYLVHLISLSCIVACPPQWIRCNAGICVLEACAHPLR